MRTAILFTANPPQIATGHIFIDSLLDKNLGNFNGDLWVLSTELDDQSKLYLDARNIRYFTNPLIKTSRINGWENLAKAQTEFKKIEHKNISMSEKLDIGFKAFKNKRLSKLIVLYWLHFFKNEYDQIVICDNDLYVQRDINQLFENCAKDLSKIYYEQELYRSLPNTVIWRQNLAYKKIQDPNSCLTDENEINIGFILSTPDLIEWLFKEIKFYTNKLKTELFIKGGWQDQSITRLIKSKNREKFKRFENGDIVHLCNGGRHTVTEDSSMCFIHNATKEKPYIIHFASGKQKYFPPIAFTTSVDTNDFFAFYKNIYQSNYITKLFSWEFIDIDSPFYLKKTIEQRNAVRLEFAKYKYQSSKKTLLIATWLNTSTHNDSYELLKSFFENEIYDNVLITNLASNVNSNNYLEQYPELILAEGKFIQSSFLQRKLGYKLDFVPWECICDCVKSIKQEWKCSDESALAFSNFCYFYFREMLLFYKPDVVALHAFAAAHRVLHSLCKNLNIQTVFIEYGVLANTYAIDFNGSMGTSDVSNYQFNKLKINDEDIQYTMSYLKKIYDNKLSRNKQLSSKKQYISLLKNLKNEGKQVILFAGSHDSGSGHCTCDISIKKAHSPLFERDEEIVMCLLNIIKQINNCVLIYKPHPIYGKRRSISFDNNSLLYQISDCSLEEIMVYTDLTIVNVSQSCYTSLIHNVPVLLLGINQLYFANCCYIPLSIDDIKPTIEKALKYRYTKEQQDNFISHSSRLLKYYLFDFESNKYKHFTDIPQYIDSKIACTDKNTQEFTTPLVSIIIPVRNLENYIHKSLNAAISQTYKNIEIIVVINDTTDNTKAIVEYYKKFDSRIKIIETEVAGLSNARNLGIDAANSDYMLFLDADDSLDNNAIEYLVGKAKESNSDCLFFLLRQTYKLTDKHDIILPRWFDFMKFITFKNELHKITPDDIMFLMQIPFAVLKFYKTEYIRNNKILFNTSNLVFEDNPHNLKTLLLSENNYLCSRVLYSYTQRTDSMVRIKSPDFIGGFDAIDDMDKILREQHVYTKYAPTFVKYKAHLFRYIFSKIPDNYIYHFFEKAKNLINDLDLIYLYDDLYDSLYFNPNYYDYHFFELVYKSDSVDDLKKSLKLDTARINYKAHFFRFFKSLIKKRK